MSSDREAIKAAFLAEHGYGGVRREALPGDASTRRYERLYPASGPSLIFMDQPPSVETAPCPPDATRDERIALGFNAAYRLAAGRVDAFVACARHLKSLGLSAPAVLAFDARLGLAVLEDLGDGLFAAEIAAGRADEAELYAAAVEALIVLHRAPAPDRLVSPGVEWPLLTYDDLALKAAGDLFVEWLPAFDKAVAFDAEAIAAWEAYWAPVREAAARTAEVFCHRDYHAENLIWLPQRHGAARVGLIDFQDAVRANRAWDFSMLLHDARRDVSPDLRAACLEQYLAAEAHLERARFLADFHRLGALNILRILGIFSRLVIRDGKPRYAAFMPRLWGYLDECLAQPGLEGLAAWFERYLPDRPRG